MKYIMYGLEKESLYNERPKISAKKIKNKYSVDAKYINSIKFHKNFDKLKYNKKVIESIYNCAIKILEERDGTCFESIAIVDAVTGKEIIYNNKINNKFETYLFDAHVKIINKNKHKVIAIHNHPNSSTFSFTDVRTLMQHNKCLSNIVAGHSGIVYELKKNKQIDIDTIYALTYDIMKQNKLKMDGNLIEERTVGLLYRKGIVKGGKYYEKK